MKTPLGPLLFQTQNWGEGDKIVVAEFSYLQNRVDSVQVKFCRTRHLQMRPISIGIFAIARVGEDGRQPLHSESMDQREIELRSGGRVRCPRTAFP